jgi:hypothetical protein
MDYLNLRNKKNQFPLLTGLFIPEFDELLEVFSEKWEDFSRVLSNGWKPSGK